MRITNPRQLFVALATYTLIVGLAVGGALTACKNVSNNTEPATSSSYSSEVGLAADKAMLSAELAFSGAVQTVDALNTAGLLDADKKAVASDVLTRAHQALVLGREAYKAGNSVLASDYAGIVTNVLTGLAPILPANTFN